MTKFVMILHLIFLITVLVCYAVMVVNVQAQPIPSFPVGSASKSIVSSENNGIKIIGIDSTAFPKIKVNLFINKSCAIAGSLKKENFKVEEDDIVAAIDNFYFTGTASGQKLDLAIVFDETTSMDEEINALKLKVKDLTQKINSSKLDTRYSLVTFNGADVITKINWTNDADSFRNVIVKLTTAGGNTELPENSLDGIEKVLSFGFRPDAQKAIIVVTDEPSQQKGDGKFHSAYTMEDVKSDLLNSSVMLIAVSPDFRKSNVDPNVPRSNLPKYADMRELGNEASGFWIDINSADFSTILKQIQGILTGIFVIEYTSPDPVSSENRTIFVSVNMPGCVVSSYSYLYKEQKIVVYWYNRGIILDQQSRYDEALKAFDKAIELDPNYAEAWSGKGRAFKELGEYDEALQAFNKAIELDPNYADAWSGKGWVFKKLGEYDEALKAFDKAIVLEPNYADAWSGKASVFYDQGDYYNAAKATRIKGQNNS